MKRTAGLFARKAIFVMLALSLAVVFYGQPAQANLVVNGSFENTAGFVPNADDTMSLAVGSTTMTGWTVINDKIAWIGPSNPWGLTASAGNYFLDLTDYYDPSPYGGVRQTINTGSGQYQLEFDLGSSNNFGIPSAITATAGSTSQTFPSTSSSNNVWKHCTMTFTASGPTTISLTGNTGLYYIGLDNVTVVPVPAAVWLLGTGLVGLVVRRRFKK
jgi:hypothetical protein